MIDSFKMNLKLRILKVSLTNEFSVNNAMQREQNIHNTFFHVVFSFVNYGNLFKISKLFAKITHPIEMLRKSLFFIRHIKDFFFLLAICR